MAAAGLRLGGSGLLEGRGARWREPELLGRGDVLGDKRLLDGASAKFGSNRWLLAAASSIALLVNSDIYRLVSGASDVDRSKRFQSLCM